MLIVSPFEECGYRMILTLPSNDEINGKLLVEAIQLQINNFVLRCCYQRFYAKSARLVCDDSWYGTVSLMGIPFACTRFFPTGISCSSLHK
jgi:hypothetical protein